MSSATTTGDEVGARSVIGRARRVVSAHPVVSSAVTLLVVAGIVLGIVFGTGSGDSQAAGARTTTTLQSVSRTTVQQSVSADGTFAPADEKEVSFGSSARITSVRVVQGQRVTKGQVLGTIDTVDLKQTLAEARSTLAQARSTLADAEDDSDTTSTQLTADKAAVASAEAAVSDASDAVSAATLRAPTAGTVAEVNVSDGDRSAGEAATGSSSSGASTSGTSTSGTSTSGTSTAGTRSGSSQQSSGGSSTGSSSTTSSSASGDFVIVGGRAWQVSATVDDTEVGLIAKGDQARITTDNATGTIFGTVSAVSVLSSGTSGSASYPVTISVTGTPTGLHDGASATVSIVYKQVADALTVPANAVQTENGASYVYVDRSGAKTKQTVTTGVRSGATTQITAGLRDTDKVYVTTIVRTGGTSGGGRGAGRSGGAYPGGGQFPGGGNLPAGGFPGGGNFPGGTGGGGYGGGNGGGGNGGSR